MLSAESCVSSAEPKPIVPQGSTLGTATETGLVMNRGGWSWKRQFGITNAKRRVSRATGIPWTKSGRQRKVGAMFWKLFK
jgi:hypothetical protein